MSPTAVRGGGTGRYWGADVVAGTGEDRYAGWSLVVVLRDPTQPLRNLTVFDGFADVGQGNPQTVTINGFLAPRTGAVDAQTRDGGLRGRLLHVGRHRDAELDPTGHHAVAGFELLQRHRRQPRHVGHRARPGRPQHARFRYQERWCIRCHPEQRDIGDARRSPPPGDRYFPGVVTTAINLYAPDFSPSTKSVSDLAGNDPALPGDTLRYTVSYANRGGDPAARR